MSQYKPLKKSTDSKLVLIPSQKGANPFFEEIIKHSLSTTYSFGNLESDVSLFDAVLIQWPEQLFNWKEPSLDQIKYLNTILSDWKKTKPIVHIVHNQHPHNRNTGNFKKLYQVVLKASDKIIHLGHYSKAKYEKLFPEAEHVVIEHPLYSTTFKPVDIKEAREKLLIEKDKFVVIVPGAIRTLKERSNILKAFKALKIKKKLLIIPRMYKKKIVPFKGYYKLRKLLPLDETYDYIANKKYVSKYIFNFSFLDFKELSTLISASNVVLIPRIENLNSGNTFLAFTFRKLIIGPNNGNTYEFLKRHNMLIYDVKKPDSMADKLNKSFKIHKNLKITDLEFEYLQPSNIAAKWDQLFKNL